MPRLKLPKMRKVEAPAMMWKRVMAFLIDLVVIDLIILMPFRGIIEGVAPTGVKATIEYISHNPSALGLLSTVTIMFGILALLYFAVLEYKIGQTVGKMVMNIYIVSEDKKISFFQSIVRSMYFIFIFPFWLLFIADPLFAMFNKDKKRLSEVLSRTRTVEQYIV